MYIYYVIKSYPGHERKKKPLQALDIYKISGTEEQKYTSFKKHTCM